jgi:deoxyribodipyrimidine photo-lyase
MNINRLTILKEGSPNPSKRYVLYWMQQSQRVDYNHALNHAVEVANEASLPLVVFFGLTPHYPDANLRHYKFMLEGLKEVRKTLSERNITFVFKLESPEKAIRHYLEDANTLVMDYGYLHHQKSWRQIVWEYARHHCPDLYIDLIDTDVIVPVEIASNKPEYGAYTLRPKLHKIYNEYRDYDGLKAIQNKTFIDIPSDFDFIDIDGLLKKLPIDQSIAPSILYHGGYQEAIGYLEDFMVSKINRYPDSNNPARDDTSKLSMYLHFGQISALQILERLIEGYNNQEISQEAYLAFFEQVLVRRELAYNYVTYHQGYDLFDRMTEDWAYQTMRIHDRDERFYLYDSAALVQCKTHDPYFNAAMKEMVLTGYMHNYMRMYWAKKIIEWTPNFRSAYQLITLLNNRYFIDGRDANSYAGIAWCFGKHDRAWTERPIFGKLRYMNSAGLERKFDMESYIRRIDDIVIPND